MSSDLLSAFFISPPESGLGRELGEIAALGQGAEGNNFLSLFRKCAGWIKERAMASVTEIAEILVAVSEPEQSTPAGRQANHFCSAIVL